MPTAFSSLDNCIHHFRHFVPSLKWFSVFKFEVITPLSSFASDESDPTLSYSDIINYDRTRKIGIKNSQFVHAFVCPEMQVCLLCHFSSPSMVKPLNAFMDLALSRLQCARFAVLSVLDPHAPSFSHAVKISVGAMEVRLISCVAFYFC